MFFQSYLSPKRSDFFDSFAIVNYFVHIECAGTREQYTPYSHHVPCLTQLVLIYFTFFIKGIAPGFINKTYESLLHRPMSKPTLEEEDTHPRT